MDWKPIKAEYIAGGTSYRKLAQKYGVSRSKLQAIATREKWVDLRGQVEAKTESKMVDSISDKASKRVTDIIDVADKLLEKIYGMLDIEELTFSTQNVKNLTSALKDIKEIKGFKSSADMREQEARIAKLQREAMKEDDGSTEVVVSFGTEEEHNTWAE